MAALRDLTFDQFVEFQFGHAVRLHGNPWYQDLDGDWWEPEPRTGIAYLTRLFGHGPGVLRWFNDAQIGEGLTALVNTMAVGDQPWRRDLLTPATERAAVWAAIADFFERFLGPRCAPILGHTAREMPQPLNTVTYMWWESFPGFANPDDPDRAVVDDAELACLERVLMSEFIVCQEAALHGLGHWVRREPRCEGVIDRYLESGTAALPELVRYAQAARTGCIL
jgi:hypothetical protein